MRSSPVICLIHGHGVDASIWDDIYPALSENKSVLKPDFSRLTNYSTIEAYAEDLHARLKMAQVEEVILIGHSMGGYIALAFAEEYPDMVRGLILFHSTAYADDAAKKEQRAKTVDALAKEGSAPFINGLMAKLVASTYPPEQVNRLVERFQGLPAAALIAGMKAMAERPDRTDVLRNAQFPVLVVLGQEDQVIPFEQASQMAGLSSRINMSALNNAGHLSMVEQPEQALSILKPFIDQF
ncbi:alpha/beta hydrolase [Spirosoma taeanense]|uniref:Alpha/beta hydrolase n=1 Tax=Spirosoma taeanense TaxID=2735870 RepID=A0A6M5Y5D4_9BACT|nr:alpha/beta hydrolase [Spirosoma taeanense]QJW88590.1 alpha/beta hydrolase [Spirosoma taeanense]